MVRTNKVPGTKLINLCQYAKYNKKAGQFHADCPAFLSVTFYFVLMGNNYLSAIIRLIIDTNEGKDSRIVIQTILRSTRKYSCAMMLRIPFISNHGTSGYMDKMSSGMWFAASPIISRFLTTASIIILFAANPSKVRSSVYRWIFVIDSNMSLEV
ncbi:hypothetical protein SAMN05660649_03749 [Desulfotomaculum arcticum]|uniref:Uncharacterized protein n=1 Tax=Desulfotruncus arcticus DSM 17038 TaxID=1121424 RepID=A0A1I2X0Y7_9FIRM|nr:hypothetical protein SAMN05660649_03749 [Desulfotomaculum arcticum] [Desulfotruncus arcticus DSM 17038]